MISGLSLRFQSPAPLFSTPVASTAGMFTQDIKEKIKHTVLAGVLAYGISWKFSDHDQPFIEIYAIPQNINLWYDFENSLKINYSVW